MMDKQKPETGTTAPSQLVVRQGNQIVIPGFASAHSHAFQRALRGRTQRRATTGSFWSWRGLMYQLAEKLDPEQIFNISRFAFMELAMSGVTAVGEFHYVHHQPDGTPYDDRLALAEAVIEAAREVGIRITLIRTAYFRGGYQQELEPVQKRFSDPSVDKVLQDVETLAKRYETDPLVNVAVAAHSIRAVPIEQVKELADYSREHAMPFHMHVAEQRREIEECQAEYGKRPVEVLAEHGILDENFVAIHATHLTDHEINLLGDANAFVCLCRTTERDLGDGLPRTSDLINAGVNICVGVDSHAMSDAFEEVRAVELDERSRTEKRTVAAEAPELLLMGTKHGFEAIGMPEVWQQDKVCLNAQDACLVGASDDTLADAVIYGATLRALDQVIIGEERIVNHGMHVGYEDALKRFETALRELYRS
ncbi:formimidoylglutamate deiminase [candidate division KSB1 bacterium]|nr:formimidoylglutamate deiminase [candidate division KSB1 bacterium]NIW17198.1 formimidoylglutamate deiminase [candidate division KSB1 bacterium]